MKRNILAFILSGIWISISEFLRNEFLLKNIWKEHFGKLGLEFPSDPANGAIWGVWSFCFAFVVFILNKRFAFWETAALSWLIGFVLMWLVIGNLLVLPFGILPYAIPLSVVEVLVAVYIIRAFRTKQ